VPAGAVWNEDERVWEVVNLEEGRRHGESRTYRADGTLAQVRRFAHGTLDGAFTSYHAGGDVSRRGTFANGQLAGSLIALASDGRMGEPLRVCCVPENAWELRAQYLRGRPFYERFFDRQGRPLLDSGAPRPATPAGVPEDADFDEFSGRWMAGRFDEVGHPLGTFRFWSREGALVEERDFRDGLAVAQRHHAPDGTLVESYGWLDREGRGARHGVYLRCFDAAANPYADARVREERGAYDQGRPCGLWTLHDQQGTLLHERDLGPVVDAAGLALSPALGEVPGEADAAAAWDARARALRDEHRVRESLCAAARAAAARTDIGALRDLLERSALPLGPAARVERAQSLAGAATTAADALDALVGGADAAAAFRALAGVIDPGTRAALDFADVSLLLEPGNPKAHLTRAFIRIEHGDDRGARADADVVEAADPVTAQALRVQLAQRFPLFDFWPAREPLVDDPEVPAQQPEQSLEGIRHVVQVYATRLHRRRAELLARLAAAGRAGEPPAWLPPELRTTLLLRGPIPLRRFDVTVPMESDTGETEMIEVHVDEDLPPEKLAGATVAELLEQARGEWAALTWLCWSCGLTRVELPDRVVPPPSFTAAVARAVGRCFAAHDKVLTGGVRARMQGIPSFTWEGIELDQLPNHLAAVAAAEYLELRSMFLWLALDDSVSPFQSDLREA